MDEPNTATKRRLRLRRNVRYAFFACFAGGILVFGLFTLLPAEDRDPLGDVVKITFVIAWLGIVVTGIYLRVARCPNCGERFSYQGSGKASFYNDFSSRCLHCQVSLDGTIVSEIR